jgi:hypothetical protein
LTWRATDQHVGLANLELANFKDLLGANVVDIALKHGPMAVEPEHAAAHAIQLKGNARIVARRLESEVETTDAGE